LAAVSGCHNSFFSGGDNLIVEFKCPKCKEIREELMFRRRKVPKMYCPKCKSEMKKVMSAANFKIKGFAAENNYSSVS